jgi:hypothetical protein
MSGNGMEGSVRDSVSSTVSIFALWFLRKSSKAGGTGTCLGYIGLYVNKPLIDIT